MLFLVLKSYLRLMQFDLYLVRGNFQALYDKVRRCPVRPKTGVSDMTGPICAAVNLASVWYWKEIRCLQRSAATTCLLRERGSPAQLVIGARQMPFASHAWVEVEGHVVNDKPYMREIYAVLDKC